MKNSRLYVLSSIVLVLMLTSTIAVFRARAIANWQGFVKPGFPDYAPSGMPDFDEKQPQFTTNPAHNQYSWCVPVAVANSLWWLDSEYESIINPTPVPPPTLSDHFNLVTSYSPLTWDDHDPKNVIGNGIINGLVAELAMDMHTDGIGVGGGYVGTRLVDVVPGITQYLINHLMTGSFEVHQADYPPSFGLIDTQVEQCQDVELFLDFWYFNLGSWIHVTEPIFELGHCVTCAGANATTSQVLVSDPYYNAFEIGADPQGREPVIDPNPGNTAVHNDAQYVSQDAYTVAVLGIPAPPGYPPVILELKNYLQINGFSIDPNWHALIRAAVGVSPLPDVEVTGVTTSKTGCAVETVGLGLKANVTVSVLNLDCVAETFNVNVTATPKTMPSVVKVGTQSVSLLAGERKTLLFVWDTTGTSYDNYTISAVADTVPGEVNTANNKYDYGRMEVSIPGDIDGMQEADGKLWVGLSDLVILALSYNSKPGNPKWNPNADIENVGEVELGGLVILAQHYNQHYP